MENVKRVEVRSGDKFVLTVPRLMSQDEAVTAAYVLSKKLGAPVIVIDDGATLSAVSKGPPDMVKDIADFHKKFGLEYTGKPCLPELSVTNFRIKFMYEEMREYTDSVMECREEVEYQADDDGYREENIRSSLEKQLDALVDLVYVALGTAHLQGFDFNEAWRRVHEANMKKVRATSADESKQSTGRGHSSDVIKPPGWQAPSHKDLVNDHAHRE